MKVVRYDERISAGTSPTKDDLQRLARKLGFRAVVCLNQPGEKGAPMTPDVENSWAHAFELEQERVPIDARALWSRHVDRFLEAVQRLDGPIYVHSTGGRRAAALLAIHLGLARGLDGDAALNEARALGLDPADDRLVRSVQEELTRRKGQGLPPRPRKPTYA